MDARRRRPSHIAVESRRRRRSAGKDEEPRREPRRLGKLYAAPAAAVRPPHLKYKLPARKNHCDRFVVGVFESAARRLRAAKLFRGRVPAPRRPLADYPRNAGCSTLIPRRRQLSLRGPPPAGGEPSPSFFLSNDRLPENAFLFHSRTSFPFSPNRLNSRQMELRSIHVNPFAEACCAIPFGQEQRVETLWETEFRLAKRTNVSPRRGYERSGCAVQAGRSRPGMRTRSAEEGTTPFRPTLARRMNFRGKVAAFPADRFDGEA